VSNSIAVFFWGGNVAPCLQFSVTNRRPIRLWIPARSILRATQLQLANSRVYIYFPASFIQNFKPNDQNCSDTDSDHSYEHDVGDLGDRDTARSKCQNSEHPDGQGPEDSGEMYYQRLLAKCVIHVIDYEEGLANANYQSEEID
jgi:hypothetical protein